MGGKTDECQKTTFLEEVRKIQMWQKIIEKQMIVKISCEETASVRPL